MRKSLLLYAYEQYRTWIFSPRILLILYTIVFLNDNLTVKMLEICRETGYSLNLAEPISLILSKSVNAVIIPLVFISLMTDFPRNEGSLFFVCRLTRTSLFLSQILFSIAASLTYIILLFIGTFLYCLGSCSFNNEWSGYTTELFLEYPEIYRENTSYFLTSATYMQGTPYKVMFHSTALLLLYTVLMSLIIMMFQFMHKKEAGVLICTVLTLCSLATDGGATAFTWIFPITHTVYGWHYDVFMRQPFFDLFGSYIYFAVLIVLLLSVNLILSRRVDLS